MRSLIWEAYSGEISYSGSLFGVIRAYSGSYSGLFGELFGPIRGVVRAYSGSCAGLFGPGGLFGQSLGALVLIRAQASAQESTRASIAWSDRQAGGA